MDPALSLAPYYKTQISTLDLHPNTRGISAHYDAVITQPSFLDCDDEFDIVSSIVDDTLFIAGYRNHSDSKRDFVNKLVSKMKLPQVVDCFRPEKIVLLGDFNMPREELDPTLNRVNLCRVGGPPHIFYRGCKPTFIDHVYSNVVSCINLRFYESLEDRSPFGHQVIAVNISSNLYLDPKLPMPENLSSIGEMNDHASVQFFLKTIRFATI